MKFHFGHQISYLKSRLYCIVVLVVVGVSKVKNERFRLLKVVNH